MIRRAFAADRPVAPLPRRGTDAGPPPSPTARDHGRARIRRIRICRVTPDTDAMASSSHRTTDTALVRRPEWFTAFLADRGTRKPSAHTMTPRSTVTSASVKT
jgi:hypothetical protein